MLSRKSVADQLKQAAQFYLLRYGFSSHCEVGLCKHGSLRADVLALNTKSHLILCEIKSSLRDFVTDHKWHKYVDYADKAYFVMSQSTYDKLNDTHLKKIKDSAFGLLVLSETTGYLATKIRAKALTLEPEVRMNLVMRLAWRGGFSRRNSRRRRIFLGT